MNTKRASALAIYFLLSLCLRGQGTFLYDQQSAGESSFGESLPDIQSKQPIGQSFTPSLDSVGFIRLHLSDAAFNGIGTTVYVNLRSGSITGAVLNSTSPVILSDAFQGRVNFLFPSPSSLIPGTVYYFQPVIQSGESFGIGSDIKWNYPGGTMFAQGQPALDFDLWFREGIIIPEPSSPLLLLTGAALFVYARCKRIKTSPK